MTDRDLSDSGSCQCTRRLCAQEVLASFSGLEDKRWFEER